MVQRRDGHIADYERLRAAVSNEPLIEIPERIAHLRSLKSGISESLPALRTALREDLGKHSLETDSSEVAPIILEIRHALKHVARWSRVQRRKNPFFMPGSSAAVAFEPKGLALILSPFNYPFNLSVGPLVSALAAGNRAVIKPSELTPATSQVVSDIVSRALPDSVAAVALGDKETARSLLELPFDHIFFSGSNRVGRIVMSDAAKFATPVTLELGGKSPAVVCAKADIDLAVRKIAAGKFLNAGQTCIGVDYALVDDSVFDHFIEKLQDRLKMIYGSSKDEWLSSPSLSRIVSGDHVSRLRNLIEDSISEGGTVVFGGHSDVALRFVAPTVVTNVKSDSALMSDEIFGPILPVIRTKSIEGSIKIARDIPTPLAVYVFSDAKDDDRRIRAAVRSGAIVTNDVLSHFVHPELPFGGCGASGFGRAHGYAGFQTFSNERTILKNRKLFRSPLESVYAPYSDKVGTLLERLLRRF
ncbi:MAG: aldehyde dehydrogenase family protein [Rhodothermales bacterium]|nr:aldehyde dehydrogenase family protein [Rhodothermales bacterium]